ncbi:MAG: hypothetical protein U1F11_12125 [Steroidobacteraceae bacterium]
MSGQGKRSERPSPLVGAMLRRELWPWALLGFTLGMVEGATAAVLLKHRFAGATDAAAVNFAVAFVSGAPAMSNVVSFVWANIAHGRARVRLMVALQAAFAVTVGIVGLAPAATGGLLLTVGSILAARVLWAGILTTRSSIWIANYPRQMLGSVTGRMVIAGSLTVALAAAATALLIEDRRIDPRWLYALAALVGLAGAWAYRAVRVRREYRLLAEENKAIARSDAFSLRTLLTILREDADYRRYLAWLGLYGVGNLMLTSQLVVIFTDQLHIPGAVQIAMLAVFPLAAQPLFVPLWARMFDGTHVIAYRARQAWALVVSVGLFGVGVLLESQLLLWSGAATMAISTAGANIGWSLGHNDFAGPGRAQHYMGVNVTLTGLRGMLAPPLGIAAYQGLESLQPGCGRWSMLIPFAGTFAGALGFTMMHRGMRRDESARSKTR